MYSNDLQLKSLETPYLYGNKDDFQSFFKQKVLIF